MTRRTLEALSAEVERQLAIADCKNLMGKVMYYGAAWLNRKMVTLWADRDDCLLELPWGIYDGIEGVKRCYLQDFGDRSDPGKLEEIRGELMVYTIDTPIINVAEDGRSAEGVWTSSGAETWKEDGEKPVGYWRWGRYQASFVREDDAWKILELHYYPMFRTKYDTPWYSAQSPADDSAPFPVTPDRPRIKPVYHYDGECIYPTDQPSVPGWPYVEEA